MTYPLTGRPTVRYVRNVYDDRAEDPFDTDMRDLADELALGDWHAEQHHRTTRRPPRPAERPPTT